MRPSMYIPALLFLLSVRLPCCIPPFTLRSQGTLHEEPPEAVPHTKCTALISLLHQFSSSSSLSESAACSGQSTYCKMASTDGRCDVCTGVTTAVAALSNHDAYISAFSLQYVCRDSSEIHLSIRFILEGGQLTLSSAQATHILYECQLYFLASTPSMPNAVNTSFNPVSTCVPVNSLPLSALNNGISILLSPLQGSSSSCAMNSVAAHTQAGSPGLSGKCIGLSHQKSPP